MSKELKSFRSKFLEIKTPEELDYFLVEINNNYKNYPDDLKLVVALISPIRAFKSFTYKVYPLATKEKISHSVILTQILNFASFMKVNLPTEQWMAGFRYVTEPFSANASDPKERISTITQLQSFFVTSVYKELLISAERINGIKISDKMVWDNKFLYGVGSFSDNFKRFMTFGEAERNAALSSIHASMANCARFAAYNLDELLPFFKETASLYGYDSSFFSAVDGVTAKKIKEVLTRSKYKNLFVLNENGQDNMAFAYRHLKESTMFGLAAWTETRDRAADENNLFNSDLVMGSVNRIDTNAEAIERVVLGETSLRSDITGEVIKVNFPSLFLYPSKDLKNFAPTGFDDESIGKQKFINKTILDKRISYRNYFYGRAILWELNSYKLSFKGDVSQRGLFPEISDGKQVSNYVRILNQATGSSLLTTILNPAIFY
jgi:hypothetical protein